MHISDTIQTLLLIALSSISACACGTVSPSPPDFEGLIPTTTDGPSTLYSTLIRQISNLSCEKTCLVATSGILQATYAIPSTTDHPSTLVGATHRSGYGLSRPEVSFIATPRISPSINNHTLSTATRTAAPGTTSITILPPTNDTEGQIQGTRPIGPMLGLWVVVSFSVAVYLAWLAWEVWRDWGEMMWLERESRKPWEEEK
jgi:hypothetical protein